jgi:hypothetical protein
MLPNLVKSASMHLAQMPFDILDNGRLLVQRSTCDDERFRTPQLLYHIFELAGCAWVDKSIAAITDSEILTISI